MKQLQFVMNVMDCTPVSINMEYNQNRLKSFDTYLKQMLSDKYQLACAGLFYSGKSDMCQCFRCHVKLSAWERDDGAIKEHFKWSPDCEYIKMVSEPSQQQSGFTFGSSASVGGFGTGSGQFVRPLDPKTFQTWRDNGNKVI